MSSSGMAWVVFFDGECGMCNQSVRRLVRWDRQAILQFAPLQGELAQKHDLAGYLTGDRASMVMLDEGSGQIWAHSDGLLQIFRVLGGPWRLLLIFGWLPSPIRDRMYRWVAGHRRRWFGNGRPVCEIEDRTLAMRIRK